MTEKNRLFWSALATGQFLEFQLAQQERINDCVDMIGEFPLIGVRMVIPTALEHRRRFVCEGFRIIYCLEASQISKNKSGESISHYLITIRRLKRT